MVGSSQDTAKQGPWLVKSGDRIMGPYSTDDLSQMIREKEVVVIDEIMAPQMRWLYVRDVEVFAPVVEDIRRGLMHSREDTEVQGYTNNVSSSARADLPNSVPSSSGSPAMVGGDDNDPTMITQTAAGSETLPNLGGAGASLPKTPSAPPVSILSQTPPRGTGFGVVTPVKPVMIPLPHHNKEAVKEAAKNANGTARDQEPSAQYVRPKIGGKSSVIIGSAVLIIAAVFIIYTVLKSPQMSHSVTNSDNLQTQASVAWKRGEFERALELYRALNHDQPGQPIIAARLATLMMKLEGQTVEAKRVIESATVNAKNDEQKSALAIASGLAALQNDDPKEASISFANAKSSWIASFDEGVAQSLLKDWTQAAKAFTTAGENAVALLMLARTHLNAGDSGVSKIVARREADSAIKKALLQAPDYQQESLVVAAYIDALMGNTKRANKEVLEAIETDPNQTNDHFHDPTLNLDQVSWPKLLPYCQSINKELGSRLSGALMGVCLAKANQLEEASKLIDSEIGKEPGNTYLHAVAAYLHGLADRDDASRASLTLSAKNGNSRLAQILSARLCMREKQDACADEAWSKLAGENFPPIAAITGLAQLRQAKGDHEAATALLVKAELMSPKYLPLLRLRQDASR